MQRCLFKKKTIHQHLNPFIPYLLSKPSVDLPLHPQQHPALAPAQHRQTHPRSLSCWLWSVSLHAHACADLEKIVPATPLARLPTSQSPSGPSRCSSGRKSVSHSIIVARNLSSSPLPSSCPDPSSTARPFLSVFRPPMARPTGSSAAPRQLSPALQ